MLKQKYLLDFGAKFFLYFMGSLVGIVIARVAGPEVVGTIAYGLSFVTMFYFVFGLFGTSHIKLISENLDNLGKGLRIYFTLLSITTVIFVIIVLAYFYIQKLYFHKEFSTTEQIVIFLFIGINVINGLTKISEVTFVGLTQQAKSNIPNLVQSIVYQTGRLTVVLLGFGAVALVSVNLATTIMVIPVYLWLMRKFPRKAPWDKDLFKKYLSIGFPILIINITNSIISNYGNLMLKDTSSILELGYFAAGASLTAMLTMIGGTAGTIFFPLFSKAYANNDMKYIRTQISKYERFLYIMALPFFLCLGVFSNPILPFLMSDKYLPSVPVFTILIFAAFFSINAMPYYNLLFGVGKFKLSAWFNVLFMFVFIGFLFLFLDPKLLGWGATGLACVMLLHNLVKYMVWYYYVKKQHQVQVETTVLWVFVLNVVYFGAFYFLKNSYFNELNIFIYGIIAVGLLALFYSILYISKLLTKNDINFLLAVFNIKKLVDYTKEELKK